jgi:transposase
MTRQGRFPQELRERAVRMVFEHREEHPSQWAAICSIATKVGVSAETLRKWVRRAEVDDGLRPRALQIHLSRPDDASERLIRAGVSCRARGFLSYHLAESRWSSSVGRARAW